MNTKNILLTALTALTYTAEAEGISQELKQLFDSMTCNIICFVQYAILSISVVVMILSAFRYMT